MPKAEVAPTLSDHICREWIERAKRLWGAERIKLQSVPAACGWVTAERVRLVCKRVRSQTPLPYLAEPLWACL